MKKVIANKPRFWFLVGVFFVLAIVAGYVIYTAFMPEQKTTQNAEQEDEGQGHIVDMGDYVAYRYSAEEWEEAKNTISEAGTLLEVSDNSVKVKFSDKEASLSINSDTKYVFDPSGISASVEDLQKNQKVVVVYNKETNVAKTILIIKESEE